MDSERDIKRIQDEYRHEKGQCGQTCLICAENYENPCDNKINTKDEAIKVIEEFNKSGGTMFIDGCNGHMSDKDLIVIAESCRTLME